MGSARRGTNKLVDIVESPVTAIDETITVDGLDMGRVHCFLGVQFFSDAAGTTPAVPTVGTLEVSVKTYNLNQFEDIAESLIQADDLHTISWAANSIAARVVPDGIDIATHYKVVITQNE